MITTEKRPTPAHPWFGSAGRLLPSVTGRPLPPELGPDALAILEGVTFMYSDAAGDVPGGSIGGLVNADTRLLSTWVLTLNGSRLLPLRSGHGEHYSAAFFLTNSELAGVPANVFGVRRLRSVDTRLNELIEVRCFAREPTGVQLRLSVGTDFADLFEIRDVVRDRSGEIARSHEPDGSALVFSYRNGEFFAQTRVEADPPATRIEGDDLVWDLDLAADATWSVRLHVPLTIGPRDIVPTRTDFGPVAGEGDGPADDVTARWFADVPTLRADSALLCQVGERTSRDLLALRVNLRLDGHQVMLPAAGLPWYLTVFGRDTLITAYQTVSFGQALARGALLELASSQGRSFDDFRDEEPGKILHEIRQGELTRLGLMPHSPYYGAADATMLWLIVLSEYWRWTHDGDLVHRLEPNLRAALEWIDRYGDRDGDGYVEYQTRSPQGLGNQCWRDSPDGIQFADGRLPYLPVATCELQGYVYDAKLRTAEMADGPLRDPALAARLRAEAVTIRTRFNQDFWIEGRGGYYAVGLDGDKRPIDSMTSNMGHLLWSGIVPPQRAGIVVEQLMSEAMFSGWGVRTLSSAERGYNPIGYHLGTVWPHDNSLIACGMTRYGYRAQANRIALAMLDAAAFTDFRLPEAFSGYHRSVSHFPVPYPAACQLQAWATAAPLVFARAMLGLEARDGRLTVDPMIPEQLGRFSIAGIHAFGTQWDVQAHGTTGTVAVAPR